MKFSISNIAWKKEENETVIDILFKHNIRNIDVAPLLVVDSLCLEPNAKEYNCNFLNTTKETIDFVKLMNSNYAKINFDTGTVLMNKENPTEIIKYAYPFIGHIHVSSPMLKPVHENTMDHLSFSNYLKEQNYSEGISIEMLTEKYKVNTVDAIEKAINVFKKFYL